MLHAEIPNLIPAQVELLDIPQSVDLNELTPKLTKFVIPNRQSCERATVSADFAALGQKLSSFSVDLVNV